MTSISIFFIGFLSAVLTGAGLTLTAICSRPAFFRHILQRLWAMSHGIEGGLASYRAHRQDNPEAGSVRIVPINGPVQMITADVISALMNLHVKEKKAFSAVRQAIDLGTPIEFEALFHRSVEIARAA